VTNYQQFKAGVFPLTIQAAGVYTCVFEQERPEIFQFSNFVRLEGAFPLVDNLTLSIRSEVDEIQLGEVFDVKCSIGATLLDVQHSITYYLNQQVLGEFSGKRMALGFENKTKR